MHFLVCPVGHVGYNCSVACAQPYFGYLWSRTCHCSPCHHIHGCVKGTLKIWKQNIFNYVEALIKCKLKKSSNVMFWLTFVQSDCSRRSLDITARDLNERERKRNEKEKRKWKNYRWCRLQIFLNYKLRKFRSIYPILVTNVLSRIHEFFLVVNNNLSIYIEE